MKKTTSTLLLLTLLLSNIYTGGNLSHANETQQASIDWSQVDWNQETILMEDQKNYERKINELIETGNFEEAKNLQIQKRKIHDEKVLGSYKIPPVVKQIVQEHYNAPQWFSAQSADTRTISEKINEALSKNSFTAFWVPTTPIPSPLGRGLGWGQEIEKKKEKEETPLPTVSLTNSTQTNQSNIQIVETKENTLSEVKINEPTETNQINLLSSDTPLIEYYDGISNHPTQHALYYLATQQDESGLVWNSLRNTYEFIELLETFRRTNNSNYQKAIHYFKTTNPKNNLELIYQIQVLAKTGEDYTTKLTQLKDSFNTDSGIGIIPGFESDTYTTIKALDLLVNINDPLMDSLFTYVEDNTNEDWEIYPFKNALSPSPELSYELLQILLPLSLGEGWGEGLLAKLQTYITTLETGNSLLEQTLFWLTFEDDTEKQTQVENIKQIVPFSQSYNGLIEDTYTTIQATKLIAQSDIEIVSIEPVGTFKNKEPAKLNIKIKNNGYKKTGDVNIHLFVDNVYYGSEPHIAFSELQPEIQIEFEQFTLQNTAPFKGDTKFDFYIETHWESDYNNNWIEKQYTFANADDNFPALPGYFVAQSHEMLENGLGINVRWPETDDPDLDSYVVLIKWKDEEGNIILEWENNTDTYISGNPEWWNKITLGKHTFSNGAFINGFALWDIIEVSVWVKSIHNTDTIRMFAQSSTLEITNNETKQTIPVSGQTLNLDSPTWWIELRSYGGLTISDYDGTYQAEVQEGKNILQIDNPEYENLIYKTNTTAGETIENKNIITKLKADTENPKMIDLKFMYDTPIKNNKEKEIFLWATDNIAVKEIDLYYYDPNAGYWIYETTIAPDYQVAVYTWNIPSNLIWEWYKFKAVAKDHTGNLSEPLEYGPFEILDGMAPESGIIINGLEDNKWKLWDTKEVTWNLENINNIESITSVALYYGASNVTIAHEVDLENQTVTYAIPVNSNYITDTAYITSRVCANDNCSDAVSPTFEIFEEPYQVQAPWTEAETVGFPMSGSNFTRGIEAVFRQENWDIEIIYSEQILPIWTSSAPYRIVYAKKENGSWKAPVTIKEKTYSNTNYSYYSNIEAVKHWDEIHLIYSDILWSSNSQRDGTEVYYAKIKNNSVEQLSQVSNDTTFSSRWKIQVDENNNIHIIWKEWFSYTSWTGTSQTKYSQNLNTPTILISESSSYPSLTAQNGKLFLQYRQNEQYYFKDYDLTSSTWNQAINIWGNGYIIESEIFNRPESNTYDIFALTSTAELSWRYYINHIKFDALTGNILLNKPVTSPTPLNDIRTFKINNNWENSYHIAYIKKNITDYTTKLYYTEYQDGVKDNYLLTSPSMNVWESYVFWNTVWNQYIVDYGGYQWWEYHLFQMAWDFIEEESEWENENSSGFKFSYIDIDFQISLEEFRIIFTFPEYKLNLWVELFW